MLMEMVFSPLKVRVICSLMAFQWRLMAATSISLSLADNSDSAISTHGSPFFSIQILATEC